MSSYRDRKDFVEPTTKRENAMIKFVNSPWLIFIITTLFVAGGVIAGQKIQSQYTDKRVDKVEAQQQIFSEKLDTVSNSVSRIDERTRMILERLK